MEGSLLFDFCAESLFAFLEQAQADGTIQPGSNIPMGFTVSRCPLLLYSCSLALHTPKFSYPCQQDRIDHGILIRWTKGFGNRNVEGYDVTQLFATSLEKYKVPVTLTALVNDTTGTLIASHYTDPSTKIGVIL